MQVDVMLSDNMTVPEAMEAVATSHLMQTLRTRHMEPWRHYHDWTHPTAMKTLVLEAANEGVRIVDGASVLAFIIWHDSIYDTHAANGRNEALSAQLCSYEFGTIGHPRSVGRACEGILATIGHRPCDINLCPDIRLKLDVDLAILGAEPVHFDRYDVGIRAEYAHVTEDLYREKRREVLEAFLSRDRLYLTDWGWERWEMQARENLGRAIATLST